MDPTPEEIARVREYLKKKDQDDMRDEFARRRSVATESLSRLAHLMEDKKISLVAGKVDHEDHWSSLELVLDVVEAEAAKTTVRITGRFEIVTKVGPGPESGPRSGRQETT